MPTELTPEDEEFFDELLSKRGKTWLQKIFQEMGFDPTKKPSTSEEGFLSYLREQADKLGMSLTEATKKLEAALEIMTPEQRAAFKAALTPQQSPKSGDGEDPNLPPKNAPPAPPNEPAPEKPKRRFGRL